MPEFHLSEDFVLSTASRLRVQLNHYLDVVQDIAVGKDFKLFIKVLFPLSRQCVPKWFLERCIWNDVMSEAELGNVTGSWSIVACCNSWVMVPFPHPYVDRYFTLLPFCVFLAIVYLHNLCFIPSWCPHDVWWRILPWFLALIHKAAWIILHIGLLYSYCQ